VQQCFRTSEREPHTYSLDAVVAETNILKKNKVTFSSILIFLLCFWGLVAPSWKFSGIALFWSIVLLNFQYKTTTHKGRNTNEKQRQQNMGKQMKAKQTLIHPQHTKKNPTLCQPQTISSPADHHTSRKQFWNVDNLESKIWAVRAQARVAAGFPGCKQAALLLLQPVTDTLPGYKRKEPQNRMHAQHAKTKLQFNPSSQVTSVKQQPDCRSSWLGSFNLQWDLTPISWAQGSCTTERQPRALLLFLFSTKHVSPSLSAFHDPGRL